MTQRGEFLKSSHEDDKKLNKCNTGKVFVVRESYHTTLLKNDQFRTIYHIFVAIFICILLDSILHDLLISGRIYLGVRTIKQGFARIHLALTVWSLMHIPIIGLYYALQAWAQVLRNLKGSVALQRLWNYWNIICFAGFQLTLLYVATKTCLTYDLPFATASALLMETFRVMMKTYAFVRTNVPQLLTDHSKLAPISAYIYYLFAPTFIYRDSYPRTEKIRWTFAIINLLEVILIIFLLSFIHERYILTNFQDFDAEKLTMTQLCDKFFAMILPSGLILLSISYLILHSWLNFTGEILRFGDRMYYSDWWTSADYETYYRSWNIVVHEWFYEYIYKDCYKYIFKGSKLSSSLVVFYLSAFMHEHVIGIALQLYYPVLFLCFGGSGVIFYLTTRKLPPTIGKVFLWVTLLIGNTFILCLYAMEFFARTNSKQFSNDGWMPVSWSFNGIIGS